MSRNYFSYQKPCGRYSIISTFLLARVTAFLYVIDLIHLLFCVHYIKHSWSCTYAVRTCNQDTIHEIHITAEDRTQERRELWHTIYNFILFQIILYIEFS
jgi:hypothetical protein